MLRTGSGEAVDLWVRDEGEGLPVVLLHGFTGSGDSMSELISPTTNRVIIPDLIGHGLSPAPDQLDVYRMEAMVGQLHHLIQEKLNVPGVLCGYSMGARLALSYSLKHAREISGLVLIGGTPGIEDQEEAAARATNDARLASRIENEGMSEFVQYWERLPLFASQVHLSDGVKRSIRRMRLAQRSHGIANSLRMASTGIMTSMWKELEKLEIPTLLITGAYDEKFTELAEQMERAIPSACHVTIPNAGHAAHTENPIVVKRRIEEFLRKL